MTDRLAPAVTVAPAVPRPALPTPLPDLGALRVLVVAAEGDVRAALVGAFEEGEGLTVVGTAAGAFGLDDVAAPDVLLWHLDDADAARRLDTEHPAVVLVPDAEAARLARQRGASGVLPHDAAPDQIAAALVAVARGLSVAHPDLDQDEPAEEAPDLTPREMEVLELVAEGLPNKLIADRLYVSESTVKFHIGSLLRKLEVYSRTEAVVRAVQFGLIAV